MPVLREFLKRIFGGPSTPDAPETWQLKGAPSRLRTKTYSSESGPAYRYFYRGYKEIPDGSGRDFVFSVLPQNVAKGVRILESEVAQCAAAIGREFAPQERYAIAKMTLFAAFDSGGIERQMYFSPNASQMIEYLRQLGRL